MKAQPAEAARLSSPVLLKHFVSNFESPVKNEAQPTAGTASPALNPNLLQGRQSRCEADGDFSHAKGLHQSFFPARRIIWDATVGTPARAVIISNLIEASQHVLFS